MKEARVLGNNIRVLLKNDQTMKQAFADALGYTPYEVEKLCDARLYTTDEDIHDIAEYFSVTPRNDSDILWPHQISRDN